MRIVVTGGTGFIGRRLLAELQRAGHSVVVASRDPVAARARVPDGVATCGLDARDLSGALDGAGAVVNLAGEPIASGRWTDARKRRIRESRVDGTRALVAALGSVAPERRPRVLASASAVGYYGDSGEALRTESDPPGDDFLARVCVEWEDAARAAEPLGMRVVLVRTGIVLGRDGGALEPLVKAVRLFAGGPIGPGSNWMSWIHLDDHVRLFSALIERDDVRGPVNSVAPEPVRQITLVRELARRLHRPCWPGIPAPIARLALGEMADAILGSIRVAPQAAARAGFGFERETLGSALDEVLGGT